MRIKIGDACRLGKSSIQTALLVFATFVLLVALVMAITLAAGKIYQHWDRDPDRGAVAVPVSRFADGHHTPIYVDQGWSEADSLWFYTTTQGAAFIPYDFFLVLKEAGTEKLFRRDQLIDDFRYLPQKPTFFNPDGLPVGFAKEFYRGKNYTGFTCAACHTGQVTYQGQAIRIDGGPAMADMVGFLNALAHAMHDTLNNEQQRKYFVNEVLALKNDYRNSEQVLEDLNFWAQKITLYNQINATDLHYGYSRLDAFGRIYNRVLQYVLSKSQLRELLIELLDEHDQPLLSYAQIDEALAAIGETVIGDQEFITIVQRLRDSTHGIGLSEKDMRTLRDQIFNSPNAPVSIPYLWDVTHSDYVQWNGLASNAGVGPLGRNAGEALGVFSILDWRAEKPGFSLAAALTGQRKKQQHITFTSSVDLINLQRLESHLKSLTSPQWPEAILGAIDKPLAARGKRIYAQYCQSCHELIERDAWDRLAIAKMSSISQVGTDPTMALNSVNYKGHAGNFKHTYQSTDVGPLILAERAPVIQILTAVTTGVVSSPDPDKLLIRRWMDWLYTLGSSFFDNNIESSMKSGEYLPDTTSQPYNSLLAYKARALNGIWATAPYLHNGSVPTLYDLLLPVKQANDADEGEYRPTQFLVGSREFDPIKVGFKSHDYDGFLFRTELIGNLHSGHEYASGRTPQPDGKVLPALDSDQRIALLEFLKTL